MPNLEYYGRWLALALGAKLEAGAEGQPAGARIEGDRVYLRGAVKVKAGQELKVGDTIFTLAAGMRPPGLCRLLAQGNNVQLAVAASGVVAAGLAAVGEGGEIEMDALSFNLTE